jgi:hypothetical protein
LLVAVRKPAARLHEEPIGCNERIELNTMVCSQASDA